MRAGVFRGERNIRVEDVAEPTLEAGTDAIVRIVRSSVCGSDLWSFRGVTQGQDGSRTGHEFTGIVESVGDDVTKVQVGDLVVAPFCYGDGICHFCQAGLWTSCVQGGFFGVGINGGQAEFARVPWADANLWVAPKDTPQERWDAVHLLSDVLLTGWHAGVMAGVGQPGIDGEPVTTAVIIGDGAVGLSGVISAKQQGATRIIAVGHHQDRLDIARQLGATDLVMERGKQRKAAILALTDGGAASVLECVGVDASLRDAISACRPGGKIGMVGVPHGVTGVPLGQLFGSNISLNAGVAPTSAYIDEVGPLVASGEIDPSLLASDVFGLEDLPAAFEAMDERRTIKAIVHPHG
jgi:threonine dehydrogenase-like Zn-dependent dehydrogenase